MQSICTLNLMLKLGSSFPFNMGMLFLIWRELGMGKFPHSWLSSHSETEFLHSRLRRSWRNTLSLFLLSHSWGNFFSRLRGFATQGGKIPSLILSRWEIAQTLAHVCWNSAQNVRKKLFRKSDTVQISKTCRKVFSALFRNVRKRFFRIF